MYIFIVPNGLFIKYSFFSIAWPFYFSVDIKQVEEDNPDYTEVVEDKMKHVEKKNSNSTMITGDKVQTINE